jgi:hypothetical protein
LFSLLKFDKFKEMILNFKKDLAANYEVNEDDTGVQGGEQADESLYWEL